MLHWQLMSVHKRTFVERKTLVSVSFEGILDDLLRPAAAITLARQSKLLLLSQSNNCVSLIPVTHQEWWATEDITGKRHDKEETKQKSIYTALWKQLNLYSALRAALIINHASPVAVVIHVECGFPLSWLVNEKGFPWKSAHKLLKNLCITHINNHTFTIAEVTQRKVTNAAKCSFPFSSQAVVSGAGELAVLVKNRWCHSGAGTVKEPLCTPDVVLLERVHLSYVPMFLCDIINTVFPGTKHNNAFVMISEF